jgi:hypothetical protein
MHNFQFVSSVHIASHWPMGKVSQSTKNNIRAQLEKNISVRKIAKVLKVPKSTVQDIKTKLGLKPAKKNLGGVPGS